MDRQDTSPSSRRDFFALACSIAAAGVPAIATAAADDDARFLEWERKWREGTASACERGIGDDECDRRADEAAEWEGLICRTPAAGLIGARVKATVLAENMRTFMEGSGWDRAAAASILDVLRRLA